MTKLQETGMTYSGIHQWINRNFEEKTACEKCGLTNARLEWALKRGKNYTKERDDYLCLCSSCHRKYDFTEDTRRKMSKSQKGKITSKETKERMSESVRRAWAWKKPIKATCKNTKEIKIYPGQHEAARKTGISRTAISNNLRGRSKSAGNYIWEYA